LSAGRPRPVLSGVWKKHIFDAIHGLSHAGARPTIQAISDRFVWKGLRQEVRMWCKTCEPCQAAKVARHTKTPLSQRDPPTKRFASLHVDIVGPLPSSEGHKYLFTVVDRFSRWPEAIPISDITAKSCANALIRGWIGLPG
jgi:cleavage and polyadenylation specificity factor subunit 1